MTNPETPAAAPLQYLVPPKPPKWKPATETRMQRVRRENEEWQAKNGPVTVRKIGQPVPISASR
ncbi:hypothetical protein [Rhodococcus sp. USK13]|uniref:hypothetical protein n=1 Tax=Rhodococcus sp. USK13 TaxID=2806442 RepID=UPI001BCD7B46|nr:hypothetical protein [Rhodococcus sp. USK13]